MELLRHSEKTRKAREYRAFRALKLHLYFTAPENFEEEDPVSVGGEAWIVPPRVKGNWCYRIAGIGRSLRRRPRKTFKPIERRRCLLPLRKLLQRSVDLSIHMLQAGDHPTRLVLEFPNRVRKCFQGIFRKIGIQ